jgi:hypothetical protein
MRALVYFNRSRKLWSVKALQGPAKGRVIAHVRNALVTGATFKATEAGHRRELGIVGEWSPLQGDGIAPPAAAERAVYDPQAGQFIWVDLDSTPIRSAAEVWLVGPAVWVVGAA